MDAFLFVYRILLCGLYSLFGFKANGSFHGRGVHVQDFTFYHTVGVRCIAMSYGSVAKS